MTGIALLAALIALQVADAVTTLACLRRGGTERNPLLAAAMFAIGTVPALLLAKALLIGVAVLLLGYPVALAVICAVYAVVVINNLRVLRHLKSGGD